MKKETRVLSTKIECRSEGEPRTITGHAAVFNRDSEVLYGSFIERIAPGAFAESIAKPDDVRALINHDGNLILGRTLSGTLQLREDEQGLHVTIDPPKTSYAQDLMESMRRGDVTQMSFGFETIEDKWTRGEKGAPDIRTLLKVRLFDVSPVTFPAYPDTDVAVRSHQAFIKGQTSPPTEHLDIRRRRNELAAIGV